MNTREVANEYRKAHWTQMLMERVAGEKIDEFCSRNGVSRSQFFYWQRKLREAACREQSLREELAIQSDVDVEDKAIVPSGWSVCETIENKPTSDTLTVEVGGFKISLDDNFNPELLTKVCKALVSIC